MRAMGQNMCAYRDGACASQLVLIHINVKHRRERHAQTCSVKGTGVLQLKMAEGVGRKQAGGVWDWVRLTDY